MSVQSKTHHETVPTRTSAVVFQLKTHVLQTKRFLKNIADRSVASHRAREVDASLNVVGESETSLWTESDPSERALQLGKVENLRVAVRKLNGVIVPAGETFSFWAQLGAPFRSRGYVIGRELREGCIVPSIAGGLCQLSNALYDAAQQANFEIVERHAHSQVVPGSVAEQGKDATIFWNYVDLRFRSSSSSFQIEAHLSEDKLIVRFRVAEIKPERTSEPARKMLTILPSSDRHLPNSCMSCGVADCFRSPKVSILTAATTTAYLVDEYWPEFDDYIVANRKRQDHLLLPMDGKKFGKENYAWNVDGYEKVQEHRFRAALRSFESRALAHQGAERQRVLLKHQEELARAFARSLDYRITHLVVAQGLLPFLWEAGVLGGRTFDVLMNNLPMSKLHERLDGAKILHPSSTTLGDFRADSRLVSSEAKALRQARHLITPHSEVAALFGERAITLNWSLPVASSSRNSYSSSSSSSRTIVFPAATLGRKGAYELREAAQKMDLSIGLLGPNLEDKDFWNGVNVQNLSADNWLDQAAAVVLPAWLEQKPRRLLKAVSSGVPVIASSACGLEGLSQVSTVRTGDVAALCAAIETVLS